MFASLPYIMVFTGATLMAYNIYRYIRLASHMGQRQDWNEEQRVLRIPISLLVLFLLGYLAVGFFGKPDLVIGGILFGGSLFVFAMIAFLEHVTERIQEQEYLRAQVMAAEQSSRTKSNFLSTVSHEMRTPMNAIIGLSSMTLKDESLSPLARHRVEQISASAEHLLSLINDILDMSRIESGQLALAHQRLSLETVLNQVNGMIGGQCATKGIHYLPSVVGTTDPCFVGDAMKLKQVLINILGNAVKFTDAGGTITFTTEQTASFGDFRTLRFVMQDTGIGMDQGFLPKLFSVFTQEDASSTNQFGGSGLGMSITKSIVEMMHGDIVVESEKGVGTTFTVTVSLSACPDVPEQEAASDARPTDGSPTETASLSSIEGLHVLVAEDVDLNAEILADILDVEGVSSERAKDGQEATELFGQSEPGHFDAILMDVRMPVMDGLAATRAIREMGHPDAAGIPIIALSANAFDEDVQHSLQAGMNAHLSKPVDPDLLYKTLAELVAARNE